MGYTTQEFSSAGLTTLHPSLYKEFQIVNWTACDIVITSADGEQTTVIKSTGCLTEDTQCVCIEFRSSNGMRIDPNSVRVDGAAKQLSLPAKRFNIPLADFKSAPVIVEEFQIVVSTVEHALIAKKMMCDYNYGSVLTETAVDARMVDPRFVFQIIDPNNQWDALLVNILGQTVVVRSGRFARLTSSAPRIAAPECGRLVCYLRYPTDMYTSCQTRQVVFDISLEELYKEEPYRLPSGDYVCVAEDTDALQRVLAKKLSCTNGIQAGSISDKMVPKEVYDAAEANFKNDVARIKDECSKKIESVTINKNAEISKLKADLDEMKRQKDSFESQVHQWEKLNGASTQFIEDRFKADAAQSKARREAQEASRHDIDNMWATLKIGATVVTGVLSFAITLLVKTSKK